MLYLLLCSVKHEIYRAWKCLALFFCPQLTWTIFPSVRTIANPLQSLISILIVGFTLNTRVLLRTLGPLLPLSYYICLSAQTSSLNLPTATPLAPMPVISTTTPVAKSPCLMENPSLLTDQFHSPPHHGYLVP